MAMVIKNNIEAMRTLGELNRNASELGKQLKKVSSGMKINGAGDDASGYSISEKMRARIRALDQDERNVQNGASLLRVAEGAIQSQLEIMKTIKQKVIDADNDTNTDIDRATIQKEIDQGYRQIEDIAWETTYNGKRLLVGDTVGETIRSWVVSGTSSLLPGSDEMRMIDLNMIADNYPTLNGVTGPFDVFTPSKIESTTLARLGFSPTIQCEGGADMRYTIDSSFDSVASLESATFTINSQVYVLRQSPSSAHVYGHLSDDSINIASYIREIDIGGCNSVADVMERIDNRIGEVTGHGENYINSTHRVYAGPLEGCDIEIAGAANVPGFSGTVYFSGGQDEAGDPNDSDSSYQPATTARLSMSNISAGMGFSMIDAGMPNRTYRVRFVEGDSAPSSANGVTTIGARYSGTFRFNTNSIRGTMADGNLTLEESVPGVYGNSHQVTNGIEATRIQFLKTIALDGTNVSQPAYATVDVTGYVDAAELISDLKGKAIAYAMNSENGTSPDYESGYPYDSRSYAFFEFVDSASDDPLDRMYKIKDSHVLDLNDLRAGVEAGQSVAEAFAGLFSNHYDWRVWEAQDANGEIIGVKFRAYQGGQAGNNEKIFLVQNNLRSYTLDYGQWFADNSDVSIPDFLDNKGFRVYCATCDDEWFNFHFVTENLPEGRPLNSDPESEDIKDIYINVSGVTDAESLVQAIYDQATPYLEGASSDYNHFMRLVADGDKLIVYDERRNTDSYLRNMASTYDYQWDETYQVGGAKIADGVWDNVTIGELDRNVKDLVIHHTDHASQNIRLRINQTTLDHLFGYQAGTREWSEFNVMTAGSREELLGNKAGVTRSGGYAAEDERGLLDMALDYLTSANTLVGAQMMRLGMAEANIVTARESTTASESTIRDADMAKEMVGYTKANILAQSAQSMLAQANQNSSSVLGLLQ